MAEKIGSGPEFTAHRYALGLLDALGLQAARPLPLTPDHPASRWAASGLMALTGTAEGPALMCPAPLAACADGALAALASLAPAGAMQGLRGAELLAERAAVLHLTRQGTVSAGGSCRLLRCADGWLALNLAREEDWALLPAWLEEDVAGAWPALAAALPRRAVQPLVERGAELGLALAESSASAEPDRPLFAALRTRAGMPDRPPRVVELASLWAGPLCGQLLRRCGAEVVKVESHQRPDGARRGAPEFFARLNAGKQSLTLDFASAAGRAELLDLIRGADIVIEGSRPRALRQLGIHAEALCESQPGLTWLSLSGHGRTPEDENRVAFGDDAAVAAGLSALMAEVCGEHLFVGDAIADPLTGLHAALAAWAGFLRGGAGVLALSLRAVVARALRFELPASTAARRRRQREWTLVQVGDVRPLGIANTAAAPGF